MFSTQTSPTLGQPQTNPLSIATATNPFANTNPTIPQTTNPLASSPILQSTPTMGGIISSSQGALGIGSTQKQHSDYKGYH